MDLKHDDIQIHTMLITNNNNNLYIIITVSIRNVHYTMKIIIIKHYS